VANSEPLEPVWDRTWTQLPSAVPSAADGNAAPGQRPTPAAQPVASTLRAAAGTDLPAGFGRFEVRRYLGEGAFGRVYEAYDPSLRRPVALKVAKPEQMGSPDRVDLTAELRDARAVTHSQALADFETYNLVCLGRDADAAAVAAAIPDTRASGYWRILAALGRPDGRTDGHRA
jgi:hypothetical protein